MVTDGTLGTSVKTKYTKENTQWMKSKLIHWTPFRLKAASLIDECLLIKKIGPKWIP